MGLTRASGNLQNFAEVSEWFSSDVVSLFGVHRVDRRVKPDDEGV